MTAPSILVERRITEKMHAAGLPEPAVTAFLSAVRKVAAGERGWLPEDSLAAIDSLPKLEYLPHDHAADTDLLKQLVVVKLNGGLGTSMGLDAAKSLLPVRGRDTFLDLIARQVLHLRARTGGTEPAFYLMNSFSTRRDTLEYLRRYWILNDGEALDFLQNMVPKLAARSLEPVSWPQEPELEWCPPGHGDMYPALLGSGLLDRLIERGVKFMFVSNADNLGATVDLDLLRYFADEDLSFLMEVAERTAMDTKGGHLARRANDGRLLLRELAQCPKEDLEAFQDVRRHRFFNTNSLWIRLDRLRGELDRHGGALPLPLIANAKTVDPRDPTSPRVLQLETAVGSAIESFEFSGAVVVPRTRFSPVKNTSDLLVLRSDACRVTDDHRLVLDDRCLGQPPLVDLDPRHYQLLTQFDQFFPDGPPSLVECRSLSVRGPIRFDAHVVCQGRVAFTNRSSRTKTIPGGVYREQTLQL